MANMVKIGLAREGSAGAELAGELTVDGHEVTVVIYRDHGQNETYTGFISPVIGLPPESRAT